MGTDGDATIDVSDDEIAVGVAFAELGGMRGGDGLLVEDMRMRGAIDAFDASQARVVAVFIDIGGVEGLGGASELLGEFPGQHNAKLGGVLTATDGLDGIVEQTLVNGGHATGWV